MDQLEPELKHELLKLHVSATETSSSFQLHQMLVMIICGKDVVLILYWKRGPPVPGNGVRSGKREAARRVMILNKDNIPRFKESQLCDTCSKGL
nr:hypothetical protein [Tanacetum cinerariifolium]